MINKVELIGRLGADPESKTLESGTRLTKISVGTTETWKDSQGNKQEETSWHHVTFFGKAAENVERFTKKGTLLRVEGRLKYRTVEATDGSGSKTRYTDINAREFTILADGRKKDEASSNPAPQNNQTQSNPNPAPAAAGVGAGADTDDDLPF